MKKRISKRTALITATIVCVIAAAGALPFILATSAASPSFTLELCFASGALTVRGSGLPPNAAVTGPVRVEVTDDTGGPPQFLGNLPAQQTADANGDIVITGLHVNMGMVSSGDTLHIVNIIILPVGDDPIILPPIAEVVIDHRGPTIDELIDQLEELLGAADIPETALYYFYNTRRSADGADVPQDEFWVPCHCYPNTCQYSCLWYDLYNALLEAKSVLAGD